MERSLGTLDPRLPEDSIRGVMCAFLDERRSRKLSPRTIEAYEVDLAQVARYLDGKGIVRMGELTVGVIRQYLLDLGETRNAGGVHAIYRVIRAMLNWYEAEDDSNQWVNPIRKVKPPKVSRMPKPGVPLSVVKRMLLACNNIQAKRDRAVILCLLDTGLRAAELTALNIGDIDLTTGEVQVRHGKGDKARVVFLGMHSRQALREYLSDRETRKPNDPLFLTDEGSRLAYDTLVNILRRRSDDAGVKPMPMPHDFRRAFAVTFLRNGGDVMRLARLMGHSSLEVTARYLYLVTDDLADIHRKAGPVDNLLE